MTLFGLIDPTSYQAIGWCVVALAALAVTINQIARLYDRFGPKEPSPPLYKEYATKDELAKLDDNHGKFRAEVRMAFDKAEVTSRTSREKIYIEQHRQAESLARNTAQTEYTAIRVEKIDNKMDRLLEKVGLKEKS